MKNVKRILSVLLLVLMTASLLSAAAYAAGYIDPERDAELTISYKDGEKPIPHAWFELYRVAETDAYAKMTLTPEFEAYKETVSGLSDLESMDQDGWMSLAATLKGYVQRDGLTPAAKEQTNADGEFTATLKPGLYLVIGYRATTEDFYTYSAIPSMLFLPGQDVKANEWVYETTICPKFNKEYDPDTAQGKYVTCKVLKIWDDEGYESIRPESVTAQLLRNGVLYEEQILNKENNWRYAWDNLDGSCEWTVVEKELEHYAVTIGQRGITTTLTNSYIAPITNGDPPVQKRITGDTPKTPSDFTFTLTAADESCPMPQGSKNGVKELTIHGAGSKEFGEILFEKPGEYSYSIAEKKGSVNGYTYDTTVYEVTYSVTREGTELNAECSIQDGKGNSCTKIEFTNNYKTPGERLPQTGAVWWPVPVLAGIGLVFMVLSVTRRKRTD